MLWGRILLPFSVIGYSSFPQGHATTSSATGHPWQFVRYCKHQRLESYFAPVYFVAFWVLSRSQRNAAPFPAVMNTASEKSTDRTNLGQFPAFAAPSWSNQLLVSLSDMPKPTMLPTRVIFQCSAERTGLAVTSALG